MTQTNPYAMGSVVPAAEAAVQERARFLQKTYTWVLYGILAFCATLWAYDNVAAVQNLAHALFGNLIVALIVLFGSAWAVHALALRAPINAFAYLAYAFLLGLLLGPMVSLANSVSPTIVSQASMVTALVFVGLTATVFITGKDFSFLRGILWTSFFGLFAVGLAGAIFGFNLGIWYSYAGALIFSGFILYDTSNILHRYPTNAHIAAAIVLFVDIVMLFKHLLWMFLASRD